MRRNTIIMIVVGALLPLFLWLAYRDSVETGEEINIVGAVVSWVFVAGFTFLYFLAGDMIGRMVDAVIEAISDLFS